MPGGFHLSCAHHGSIARLPRATAPMILGLKLKIPGTERSTSQGVEEMRVSMSKVGP